MKKDFSVSSYEPNNKKTKRVDGNIIEYEERYFIRDITFPIETMKINGKVITPK